MAFAEAGDEHPGPETSFGDANAAASTPSRAKQLAIRPSSELISFAPVFETAPEDGATAAASSPAAATPAAGTDDAITDLPERFTLRLAGGWVLDSTTTVSLGGRLLQADIDWEDTLGGDVRGYSFRADARYRFNPRHALSLAFYGLTREGDVTLGREIEIGDETFPVEADLESDLSLYLTRLFYTSSFYRSEQVELGVNLGLYFGYVGLSASASTVAGEQVARLDGDEAILVPIPTLGLNIRYNILPRLAFFSGIDWFYIEAAGWRGSLTELYFGLEFRAFDHFGFGMAYDRLAIEAEGTLSDDGSVDIENDWNVVYAFISFYF